MFRYFSVHTPSRAEGCTKHIVAVVQAPVAGETARARAVGATAREAYTEAYRRVRAHLHWGNLAHVMLDGPIADRRALSNLHRRAAQADRNDGADGVTHVTPSSSDDRVVGTQRPAADRYPAFDERDMLRNRIDFQMALIEALAVSAADARTDAAAKRTHIAQLYRAYDRLAATQHALLSAVALTMQYLEDGDDTASDAYQALDAGLSRGALGLIPRLPATRRADAVRVIARQERRLRDRDRQIRQLEQDKRPLELAVRDLDNQLNEALQDSRRYRQQADAANTAREQAERTLDDIQDALRDAGHIGHVKTQVSALLRTASESDSWKQRYQDLREQQAAATLKPGMQMETIRHIVAALLDLSDSQPAMPLEDLEPWIEDLRRAVWPQAHTAETEVPAETT